MRDDAGRSRGRGADRTGTGGGAQDGRVAAAVFACALIGWMLVSMTHGGTDLGDLPSGSGATALAWGLVGACVLATIASWYSGDRAWGRPAVLGLAGLGGLVAWSAVSTVWASAPDRAWLTTNRVASGLAAMVLGIALTTIARTPAQRGAIGLTVAAVPVLLWAVASRVLPEWFAPIVDAPRISAPIGHANTLALIAVFVVPGALCLTAEQRWRRQGALITMVALLVLAMTGSRSGILALFACVAVALWAYADRPAIVSGLGAAALGAVIPAVYAVGAKPFTQSPYLSDPAERRGAGLVLGVLVCVGALVAWITVEPLAPAGRRIARWLSRPAAGRLILVATGALVTAGIALAALLGRGAESGAGRSVSLDSNHRTDWWAQAWRGFVDAPLAGHGAGSFPLTHIAQRSIADDTLRVRQPHQLALEIATELGLVGIALGVLLVIAVLWAARRAGRAAGPALAIVVAFLVQAQLDIPWTSPAAALPAVGAVGVVLALGAGDGGGRSSGRARLAVIAVLAIGATFSALVVWHGERRASSAVVALDTDPATALRLAAAAADDAWPSIGPYLVQAKARASTDPAGAQAAAEQATRRQPDNPFAWQCLAAVGGDDVRANALDRWTHLDPKRDPTVAPSCQPGW